MRLAPSIMTMEVQLFSSVVLFILISAVEAQRGVILNKPCYYKRELCAPFGYICGQNMTCQCDRFYILNRYGDKCVGGVEAECRYDEHCIEGAFCELQKKCQCKEDLYPSEDGFACSRSKQLISCEPQIYVLASLLFYALKVM